MTDGTGLRIDGLRVRYVGRREPALAEIDLQVEPGSVATVAGRTGAGKSTLALAASGFVPRVVRASVEGSVRVGDTEATTAALADLAGKVGVVFSSPALQLSSSKATVREELAFGLENLGVSRDEMDQRIDTVLERLGITQLADREPLALSGGEQQRVAIASILVMGTGLLVLDEPAAQLDPGGTAGLASVLAELADDGRAVLVAEHAPEILATGRTCLVLDGGRAAARGLPGQALGQLEHPPTLVDLARAAGLPAEQAFDEAAIADALRKGAGAHDLAMSTLAELPEIRSAEAPAVQLHGVVHSYGAGVTAVRGVDLSIAPGESVAIVGQNGSGKTTLAKHFNGLLRPDEGAVLLGGRDISGRPVNQIAAEVGFVFQNPDDQLFNSRVDREVAFGPRNLRFSVEETDRRVAVALELVGLAAERATNPYDLGLSLRKLVAMASVLAMEPPVLVLDEPTTGQDGPGVRRVGSIARAWTAAGRTLVAITHDMEFAAEHFRRIVVMRRGEVIADGPPHVVFAPANAELLVSTGLRPPPAARIAALMGLSATPATAHELLGSISSDG